jgi:hypothetical protein
VDGEEIRGWFGSLGRVPLPVLQSPDLRRRAIPVPPGGPLFYWTF